MERFRNLCCLIWMTALDVCYIAGIQTVRLIRRLLRRVKWIFQPVTGWLQKKWRALANRLLRWLVLRPKEEMQQLRDRAKEAGKRWKGAGNHLDFFRMLRLGGIYLARLCGMALNVALPVAGILLFLNVLHEVQTTQYCLELSDNGVVIGYAENETVIADAETMVVERTGTELSGQVISPIIRLAKVTNETNLMTDSVLCNVILRRSSDRLTEATGLYVNGDFRFAVKSKMDLRYILQKILAEYTDENTVSIAFDDEVRLEDGLYYSGLVVSSEDAESYLRRMQQSVYTYTVQSGDTLESIAFQAGMTETELLELNPELKEYGLPSEGSSLVVQDTEIRLSIRKVQKETYTEETPYKVVWRRTSNIGLGYTSVSQKGTVGITEYTDTVTYVNSEEVQREHIAEKVLSEPLDRVVMVGTRIRTPRYFYLSSNSSAGDYAWPVPASRLVWQGYSYYHDAIDISARPGISVVAANAGTVTSAGWHYGYGYCLTVRHANGDTSFYAHCSKLLVSAGDAVTRGQTIARVGNTGSWSNGSHLHFEIRVNGRTVNPLNYISG